MLSVHALPGWFSNVSSSSLATTILSLSALSMTNMIAWPSLKNEEITGINVQIKVNKIGVPVEVADSLVVVFPKVSVSTLSRHVKHCEGKTARRKDREL